MDQRVEITGAKKFWLTQIRRNVESSDLAGLMGTHGYPIGHYEIMNFETRVKLNTHHSKASWNLTYPLPQLVWVDHFPFPKGKTCEIFLRKIGAKPKNIRAFQFLVGGFNPFEKYARQIGSFPQGWKEKTFKTITEIPSQPIPKLPTSECPFWAAKDRAVAPSWRDLSTFCALKSWPCCEGSNVQILDLRKMYAKDLEHIFHNIPSGGSRI